VAVVTGLDALADLLAQVGLDLARLLVAQGLLALAKGQEPVGEGVEALGWDLDVGEAAGVVAQREVARAFAAVGLGLAVGVDERTDGNGDRDGEGEERGQPGCAARDRRQAGSGAGHGDEDGHRQSQPEGAGRPPLAGGEVLGAGVLGVFLDAASLFRQLLAAGILGRVHGREFRTPEGRPPAEHPTRLRPRNGAGAMMASAAHSVLITIGRVKRGGRTRGSFG